MNRTRKLSTLALASHSNLATLSDSCKGTSEMAEKGNLQTRGKQRITFYQWLCYYCRIIMLKNRGRVPYFDTYSTSAQGSWKQVWIIHAVGSQMCWSNWCWVIFNRFLLNGLVASISRKEQSMDVTGIKNTVLRVNFVSIFRELI